MFKTFFRALLITGVSCVAAGEVSMASGNVQVALEGSLLTIFGDNVDNSIEFKEVLNATTQLPDITVTGLAGTLVNGLPSVTFPSAVLNATEIRMENGNDSVVVLDVNLGNDLYVELGEGNDSLFIDGSLVGNNLAVEGGLGDDKVTLIGLALPTVADVGQELYIDGGLGRLDAKMEGMNVGANLTIIGDEANDSVVVNGSTAGDTLSIETKGGSDTVLVSRSAAFLGTVNTDAGADVVSIADFIASEDLGVFTGVGNDVVNLTNVATGKNVIVSLDAGRDSFTGSNVSAAEDAIFEGGAGVDTLTNRGIRGGKKVEFKEFEVRL